MLSTEARLRNELAEAHETIRYLREAMAAPLAIRWRGLRLTRSERVLLAAIAETPGRIDQERLRTRLDVARGRHDTTAAKSVGVLLCKLRRKLRVQAPRVTVRNEYGVGYWLDDESRSELAALRVDPG